MRCKRCNKNVGTVYNGFCTACMSLNAKEVNDEINDIINSAVPDCEMMLHPEELDEPGGFAKIVRESNRLSGLSGGRRGAIMAGSGGTVGTDGKSGKTKKPKKGKGTSAVAASANVGDFSFGDILRGEFSEKDVRAYMPVIKGFAKKYGIFFDRGTYFVCKESDFGQADDIGGKIIETRGGLVVFEKQKFYDPDKTEPDSYQDDNELLDEMEDEEEFDLGSTFDY